MLQQLMRRESIETTMKYYVGRNAENVAETLLPAIGDLYGDPKQKPTNPQAAETALRQGVKR